MSGLGFLIVVMGCVRTWLPDSDGIGGFLYFCDESFDGDLISTVD